MKIKGIVKKSLGRGKKLGFPTANIEVSGKFPEEGIHIGTVGPMELPALIFVGAAKTFDETEKKIEIYILDFDGDIYGEEIEVDLVKKLRDNMKFASTEELVAQMKEDERSAQEFFADM